MSMAMVLQTNRAPNSTSSTVPMDSYEQLQQSTDREDSFHRIIFDKIEEGKRDRDVQKCQQILNDLMTMLKHLTADVNNYNLAFRETRPPFYMQVSHSSFVCIQIILVFLKEFQRLTDRIEILTKARDILAEFLRELKDTNSSNTFPYSSSLNDVSTMSQQFQQNLQYSPTLSHSARSSSPQDIYRQHTSSISSIHSGTKENFPTDYHLSQRSRSPTLTPSNFIRIHFPNKHTTAVSSSSTSLVRSTNNCFSLARSTK